MELLPLEGGLDCPKIDMSERLFGGSDQGLSLENRAARSRVRPRPKPWMPGLSTCVSGSADGGALGSNAVRVATLNRVGMR